MDINNEFISERDMEQLNSIRIALEQTLIAKLEKAGIYHRSYSRVKSEGSLEGKLATGKYDNEGKKIQDLLGIRINLFFYEDINICEQIINDTFKVDNWSKSKRADNNFEAQKRNCVCLLPSKYVKRVSEDIWLRAIDKTFEIQLRTLLFEGWHEIEHDMRYKNKYGRAEKSTLDNASREFDTDAKNKLSRVMNSIIANLELCDWSMVEVYNQLAREQFMHKQWERALLSRYRLIIEQSELNEQVKRYFDDNFDIAKSFFDVDKQELVMALLSEKGSHDLTQNRLVYVINKSFIHDDYIEEILVKEQFVREKTVNVLSDIRPLVPKPVYLQDTYIDEDKFDTAVGYIYEWAREHMKNVFPQLPENPTAGINEAIGHKFIVNYEPDRKLFNLDMQHISGVEAGVIWHTLAKLSMKNQGLKLSVKNICESYNPTHRGFSRPEFMRDIYNEVGFNDCGYLVKGNEIIPKIRFDEAVKLIKNPYRRLPVVLVTKSNEPPEWAVDFDGYIVNVKTLRKSLGGLCHFFKIDNSVYEDANVRGYYFDPGSIIYWKKNETIPMVFSEREIRESYFEENRNISEEKTQYEKAFRFLLKEMIREEFLR